MLVESLETFPIGSKKSFKKSFCELKRPTPIECHCIVVYTMNERDREWVRKSVCVWCCTMRRVYFDSLDSLLRFTRCNETNLWKYHRVIWLRSGMKSDENNSISWIQADYADVWLQKWNSNDFFSLLSRRRRRCRWWCCVVVVVVALYWIYFKVSSSDHHDSYFPCSSKFKFL